MSKFALVGLSEPLRHELHHEREIHVCTILPGATDTPIWKELVALGLRRQVAA